MLTTTASLELISGLAGLFVGAAVAFAAPRLVAPRLSEPIPYPDARVLIPVAGGWLSRWRVPYTLGVQVLTALIFGALAAHYGAGSRLLLADLYSALLITIAYVDLDHRLVLNRLSYPGIVLALVGAAFWPGLSPLNALAGALAGFGFFLALQLLARGAMGMGDVKLAILVGAMCGFPAVLNALLLGTVLGGIAAAFALFVLRTGRKATIAYGPYLAAGAILAFLTTTT
jgi:leader peptidase (prepilin peptidase)/N-methyltransferase